MSEYRSSWWSINLQPGWSAQQSPECVSFFRDGGVGALQISAYKHDSDAILPGDLEDFTASEFSNDVKLGPVTCGALSGEGVDYVMNERFWLKRWLQKGPLLLYATYTCDANDCALEIRDVNAMLGTLKLTDAG